MAEVVDHPAHYGGADNTYEAIKVIEAWGLGFHLGSVLKYIARAGKKDSEIQDLKKARWYLQREASRIKRAMIAHIDRFNTFSAVEPEGNVLTAMQPIFSGHINLELLTSCEHAIRHIDAELQKRGAA